MRTPDEVTQMQQRIDDIEEYYSQEDMLWLHEASTVFHEWETTPPDEREHWLELALAVARTRRDVEADPELDSNLKALLWLAGEIEYIEGE